MSGIKDQEKIEALRQKLYERGDQNKTRAPQVLSDTKQPVAKNWQNPPQKKASEAGASANEPVFDAHPPQETMSSKKPKRDYRQKILLAGFAFFVVAMGVSSLFLAFGNNSISGENISIAINGPFTVGAGSELALQVGITNGNTVPIKSATLIVEYPDGTLSPAAEGEESRQLSTERMSLQTIEPGETVNIPLRARVFGEENQEKLVRVSVEYRVEGSNATFFKEAEPLRFKISSSPVSISADTLKKISSGQEAEVELTIASNSPTPLTQVLVQAEYPSGFDFTESSPSPAYGQNTWVIENLEPESEEVITITGIVVGDETDEYAIKFSVGVPAQGSEQTLASVFGTAQTQFQIEEPFLDIDLSVEGQTGTEVVASPGERSSVVVEFTNTLDDTLYDTAIEVQLSGNAFSIYEVGPSSGYFDSSENTITWDVSNTPSLQEIVPGETQRLSFTLEPSSNVSRTPQINLNVNTSARRVSESDVAEELVGTASSVIKVVTAPGVHAEATHDDDIFNNSGPVPPEVDEETTYTITLMIENGSNEITEALLTTSLPPYVTWLDQSAGAGDMIYNPTTRNIEWSAGDIGANAEAFASFQVSLLPRQLQLGTTPTLISEQRVRAVDRFTGTVVRASSPAVTTRLAGEGESSGIVRASEDN